MVSLNRSAIIALLTVATASCTRIALIADSVNSAVDTHYANEHPKPVAEKLTGTAAVLGCYEIRQQPEGSGVWPAFIQLSDEKLDYEGKRWRRIKTTDPLHKLTVHSLWTLDGDSLRLIFAPDDFSVSDNYGSQASLHATEHGYAGTITTVTLGVSDSTIELKRRSCGGNP